MARTRRELEGEAVATLLRVMPVAMFDPKALMGVELNPFKEAPVESEMMRRHKEGWARDKFRGDVRSAANADQGR